MALRRAWAANSLVEKSVSSMSKKMARRVSGIGQKPSYELLCMVIGAPHEKCKAHDDSIVSATLEECNAAVRLVLPERLQMSL